MRPRLIAVTLVAGLLTLCVMAQNGSAAAPQAEPPKTVAQAYPTLASGALLHAKLTHLPDGVLLRGGGLTLTQVDIDAEIAKAPQAVREQLRKNAFFLLENLAARRLLLQEAKAALAKDGKDASALTDQGLLNAMFDKLAADAPVTDAQIADFYEKNKESVGGQPLNAVKPAIASFMRQQKRQEIADQHVKTMGQRVGIEVAAGWVEKQAKLALDNPVDKVRASGKPSLVDFGSKGCRPCDMLQPILGNLRGKYDGKANVLFISVVEEQILASRYGVQSIPTLIFFDSGGKEVFRHTGFWPQDEIEKKLAEMGAK